MGGTRVEGLNCLDNVNGKRLLRLILAHRADDCILLENGQETVPSNRDRVLA